MKIHFRGKVYRYMRPDEKANSRHYTGTVLVNVDDPKDIIVSHTNGSLMKMLRSVEVSQAIQEWESKYNKTLYPRA